MMKNSHVTLICDCFDFNSQKYNVWLPIKTNRFKYVKLAPVSSKNALSSVLVFVLFSITLCPF